MPTESGRLEEIFHAALGRNPGDEREAFLAAACCGRPELRQRLAGLLAAHEAADAFLPLPAARETTATLTPPESADGMVGPYKLVESIGEGGFGIVFLAEQREPMRRRVAIKILKPGMDSRQVVARFEAERQALALMDHPNIAKVFDAGTTNAGRPYFVMELVKGISITDYCNQCSLSTAERLALFISVCQAVQHAHQKGVIHRDIKPSNVLVAMHEGLPAVKVIDFGVAKAINQRLTDESLHTGFAQMVGTPIYMSPEQAEMSPLEVDTRGDIYSLGVLLYELLTGTTPFLRERFREANFDEIRRIIREEEPPTPSSRLSTLNADAASATARERRTEPRRLVQSIRGDLDWIVMKCLEKDRTRRYEATTALIADIQRYLAHEPVSAVAPTATYKFRKFLLRNRAIVIMTAVVAAALLTGTGVAAWQALAASRAQAEAEAAQSKAIRALRSATDDVVERLIGSKPSLGPNERAYVESALKQWESFANEAGDSLLARRLRAEGAFNVANLESRLGRAEAAEQHYRASAGLLEELIKEYPYEPAFRADLARCHNNLANLLAGRGQNIAARGEHTAALETLTRLADQFPDTLEYQHQLATTEHNLGGALVRLGEMDRAASAYQDALGRRLELADRVATVDARRELAETYDDYAVALANLGNAATALGYYDEALKIQTELVAASPQPDRRRELAATYGNKGVLLANQGDSPDAREAFDKALALHRALAEEFPNVLEYQSDLSTSYRNLGALLSNLRQFDAAREKLQAGIKIDERLVNDAPSPAHTIGLAGAYGNLASVLRDSGQVEASLAWFDKSVDLLEALSEPDATAKTFLRNNYTNRAQARELAGQRQDAGSDWEQAITRSAPREHHAIRSLRAGSRARAGLIAEAVQEADALRQMPGLGPLEAYNLACVYSIASDQGKQRAYVKAALEQLDRAVEVGYRDLAALQTDPDLDALRDEPRFHEIVTKLELRLEP